MFDYLYPNIMIDYTSQVSSKITNPFKKEYTPPEPTGDELLDEMLELQAYRDHQKQQNLWKELLRSFSDLRQQNKVTIVTATQPKR